MTMRAPSASARAKFPTIKPSFRTPLRARLHAVESLERRFCADVSKGGADAGEPTRNALKGERKPVSRLTVLWTAPGF
jgi:hypothetical protein